MKHDELPPQFQKSKRPEPPPLFEELPAELPPDQAPPENPPPPRAPEPFLRQS
jgi:hypothetical protein